MNQKGFTLLETMVAVAIVAVLVMVAVPNYLQQTANQRLKDDTTNIRGDLQTARMVAMTMGVPVAVAFNAPAVSQYQAFLDDGRGGGTSVDNVWNGCERLIGIGGQIVVPVPPCAPANLPSGVIRTLGSGITATTGLQPDVIAFAPSGRRSIPAQPPANVILGNNFGSQRTITITAIGEAQ